MNESSQSGFVYGPVPSRRLGHSLGVDLVPFKVCSYDCIYCQLGRTTNKTIERKQYAPVDGVIRDVREYFAAHPRPDYITLSGSGEPTLNSGIGRVIEAIKELTEVPVVVLTNGSLLWMPEVSAACAKADLVMPSLDAGAERNFYRVNRPVRGIAFERMVEGLVEFRRQFSGQIWLEVMLVGGFTDTLDEVRAMHQHIQRMQPQRVQVNTVVRPPAEEFAERIPDAKLAELAGELWEDAEIIAPYEAKEGEELFAVTREEIVALLSRRPCALDDIADGLGVHRNEVVKYLQALEAEGVIASEDREGERYYFRGGEGQAPALQREE